MDKPLTVIDKFILIKNKKENYNFHFKTILLYIPKFCWCLFCYNNFIIQLIFFNKFKLLSRTFIKFYIGFICHTIYLSV